jgi:hypothetical protein
MTIYIIHGNLKTKGVLHRSLFDELSAAVIAFNLIGNDVM